MTACFNSQPPEGGWLDQHCAVLTAEVFQLTAARRRLVLNYKKIGRLKKFQLTAARRRLGGKTVGQVVAWAFQLTAARRRLVWYFNQTAFSIRFQLTAARRRLVPPLKPLTGKACIALFR